MARLRERKVLLPGVSTLARLVAKVRDDTTRRLRGELEKLLTTSQRYVLDSCWRSRRGRGCPGVVRTTARTAISCLVSSLNTCQSVIVAITDRIAAWRRERRVLARVSQAAWRLEQARPERAWALASARAEGVSIRTLAAAAGLAPARVHQITTRADLDELDAALGELRAAG